MEETYVLLSDVLYVKYKSIFVCLSEFTLASQDEKNLLYSIKKVLRIII